METDCDLDDGVDVGELISDRQRRALESLRVHSDLIAHGRVPDSAHTERISSGDAVTVADGVAEVNLSMRARFSGWFMSIGGLFGLSGGRSQKTAEK
jgi:hypothetical protein